MTTLCTQRLAYVLVTAGSLLAFSLIIEQQHHDTSTLRTLYRFKAFKAVPLDHEIAYADVAKKIGLDEDRTRRVLQHAMTAGFFHETKPGYVVHSASSAAVARDERLRAMIGHFCEESYEAVIAITDRVCPKMRSANMVSRPKSIRNGSKNIL